MFVFKNFVCYIKVLVVVFEDQYELDVVFKVGDLDKDCIVVVCFQGFVVIGMLELYCLILLLGVLQDCGFKVVFVIDGCMFGVFGKVFVVIYVIFEVYLGGLLFKVELGDIIELNIVMGELILCVDEVMLVQCIVKVVDLIDVY